MTEAPKGRSKLEQSVHEILSQIGVVAIPLLPGPDGNEIRVAVSVIPVAGPKPSPVVMHVGVRVSGSECAATEVWVDEQWIRWTPAEPHGVDGDDFVIWFRAVALAAIAGIRRDWS